MSLIDAIRRVRRTPLRLDPDGDPGPPLGLEGRRILLVYLFPALGDAILIGPVAKALLDGGAKKVGLLVRRSAARILKALDLPIDLLVLPDELALPGPTLAAAKGERAAALATFEAQLKKKRYDVAVDLTFRADVDGRRFTLASGAPARLGWCGRDEDPAELGLTHGTPDVRHQADRHWCQLQLLPLRGLGVKAPAYGLPFDLSPKARAAAAALYGEGRARVLLVPGARDEKRRFPEPGFLAIGRHALALGGKVVIAGSPDEAPLVKSLKKALGSGATGYTQKDLHLLLALIASADVVITNDTGPMHFSFLLDRPTIAIFTRMSPLCWGPPQPKPHLVVLNASAGVLDDARIGMYTRAVIHDLERLWPRRS